MVLLSTGFRYQAMPKPTGWVAAKYLVIVSEKQFLMVN